MGVRKQTTMAKKKMTPEQLRDRNLFLDSELKTQERENRRLRDYLANHTMAAEAIERACGRIKTRPVKRFTIKKHRPKVSAVYEWGDWHIGEVTLPEEMGGRPGFNYKVARKRMDRYVQATSKWLLNRREVLDIQEIVIVGLGDWISGDIHPDLVDTEEFPTLEQPLRAGALFAESVAQVRENLQLPIRIVFNQCDNHGRTTKKPRAKRKAAHNLTMYVLDKARTLLGDMTDLSWETSPDPKIRTMIQKWGFLCMHGDGIRGWAGIPHYGIQRAVTAEYRRLIEHRWDFRFMLLGHFHIADYNPAYNYIINASLTGTTELDEDSQRSFYPAQNAFLVSPKHGVFDFTDFRLDG